MSYYYGVDMDSAPIHGIVIPTVFGSIEQRSEWLADSPNRVAITNEQRDRTMAAYQERGQRWFNNLSPDDRAAHDADMELE